VSLNISHTEENYLKAIFHLQTENKTVTTNGVAEYLGTRAASVTDMMKKLSKKNLLHYKPYYGFTLSSDGKKFAINIIRRHRLWEFFLSEKLGFGWEEVHDIAEQLEHVTSKKLIDKLDEFLGFPSYDPHGDPIPDNKGKLRKAEQLSLSFLDVNQPAQITSVSNQSDDMLEDLAHKKIGIGTLVEVKKIFRFDQSMEIKLKTGTVTISEQLAKNLFVKKL
jgi:DtxR family Mn-dependent transcriptional regulator